MKGKIKKNKVGNMYLLQIMKNYSFYDENPGYFSQGDTLREFEK